MVSNIDEVPLHFDGIGLKTCLDDTRLLKAKIIAHYRHNLTYQVLKLLGSLDLIGNPLGLLNNFKVGIKDAITKPIEGFV
jgi:vacuolar protein sorting-associated protein 13A/C